MKRSLTFCFILLVFLSTNVINGQTIIYGVKILDTTVFTFEPTDSLHHTIETNPGISSAVYVDTTGSKLWKIGKTTKIVFSSGDSTYSCVTDLSNPYPVNANDWFVLKMPSPPINVIVGFWHKYQTSAGRDGGVVEYSIDSGVTWQNVKGACNSDSLYYGLGVRTSNFYGKNDTLSNGYAAFSGSSSGWMYSELQFFMAIPLKPASGTGSTTGSNGATGAACSFMHKAIYLRFRFVSDGAIDTLAGWAIDNIKVRGDEYSGVPNVYLVNKLQVYPNPSNTGTFTFPTLTDEQNYNLEVYNVFGERILKVPYVHLLDLGGKAAGMYLYRVSDGVVNYSGTIIKE